MPQVPDAGGPPGEQPVREQKAIRLSDPRIPSGAIRRQSNQHVCRCPNRSRRTLVRHRACGPVRPPQPLHGGMGASVPHRYPERTRNCLQERRQARAYPGVQRLFPTREECG